MTKVDAYVRQLIQSWVRSPAYHRKLTRTFDEKDEKDEKKDSSLTGRVRARICFIAISLTIIIGCNIFEESSQTVAYRAGKAWPYLLAYVVKFVGMWFYMLVNTSDPDISQGKKFQDQQQKSVGIIARLASTLNLRGLNTAVFVDAVYVDLIITAHSWGTASVGATKNSFGGSSSSSSSLLTLPSISVFRYLRIASQWGT
eukprot:CAMPEP_0167745144 /NCGR_PEP_ID=MMETSP0110_2-20121227/2986_1 /TAXON_ID=629695 /ORGANISM="Gymnochlora sp., Strain CCMP2014" /LENGTH=199 /DNA_ID=CAMNT_0007629749 /DNA_START=468 /DNA_END=1068 /DNA_ORIENTATION=+